MKKLYTTFLSMLIAGGVYAQCTPNGTYTSPGIYPPAGSSIKHDSIYVLPGASIGVNYSETINLVVPEDTTIVFGATTITADIDSMRVLQVNNMPAWLSYACNSRCSWVGGDNGCMNFSGLVPNSTNTYLMEAKLEVFANLGAFGQVSDTFSIWIEVSTGNSIGLATVQKSVPTIGPNPMSNRLQIVYTSARAEAWSFELMDVTGRVVHNERGQFRTGNNRVSISRNNWPEGMYLYRFRVGDDLHTGRLIVRDGL
ncbi:MAG: T9SS type A sorting domain-containing protein [Bacteroidetes bacterium]|nr:MAG: T9SS type A sorting domain-containing protein [Bacteroidota bacterium]